MAQVFRDFDLFFQYNTDKITEKEHTNYRKKERKKNLRSIVFLLSFQALNAAPRTFSVWAQNVAATKIRQSSFFLIFKEIV
jgi:hypothetical protein